VAHAALAAGREPDLPPPPLQYADYAAWEAGRDVGPDLAYWQAHLAGAPALLDLPTDFQRPAAQSFAGGSVRLHLDVDPPGAGRVALTALVVDGPWTGVYFAGVPVTLRAMPSDGWVFDAWSDPWLPEQLEVEATLTGDSAITARFVPGSSGRAVINEINYKSADDFECGDWVEFHNPGAQGLDLSGWQFRDEQDDHIYEIPGGTVLGPGAYLVLAASREDFTDLFPEVQNLLPGHMDFGLGREDMLRLYDGIGELRDLVIYSNDPPWPPEADGMGPTLELIHAAEDNLPPEAWAASLAEHGTPGTVNSATQAVSAPDEAASSMPRLWPPAPNPFNPSTVIRLAVPTSGPAELIVYATDGRRVRTLHAGPMEAGEHRVTWSGLDDRGRPQASGLYLISLRCADSRLTCKALLLK